METYRIKPLGWVEDIYDSWRARTCFGSYRIEKEDDVWWWGYCFDERYDENYFVCSDLEEGKRLAEGDWQRRIKEALEVVDG